MTHGNTDQFWPILKEIKTCHESLSHPEFLSEHKRILKKAKDHLVSLDAQGKGTIKKAHRVIEKFGITTPEEREKILLNLLRHPTDRGGSIATDAIHGVAYITLLFAEAGLPIRTEEDGWEARLFHLNLYEWRTPKEGDEKRWKRKILTYVKESLKNKVPPTFRGAHELIYAEVYKRPLLEKSYGYCGGAYS